MKETQYLEIVQCAIQQTAPSSQTISSISLFELYEFSSLNKLLLPVTGLLSFWPINTSDEQDLITWWKNEAARLVFLEYNKHALIKQLLQRSVEKGIPFTFFKGYILADLYSDFTMRNSSDTDIYVEKIHLKNAIDLLISSGYRQVRELDEEDVFTFLYEKDGHSVHKIELHTSLYEDLSSNQIAVLDKINLISEDTIIPINCCKLALQTLNHQNHLIYQIVHMAKHLCCHGFPARYLIDTSLFIKKYYTQINWSEVELVMNQLGYSAFYLQLVSILIHYFNVPEYIINENSKVPKEAVFDLLKDILHFGMRSYSEKISHYYFLFEQYIEKLEKAQNDAHITITFDGETIPADIVPIKYQSDSSIQNRIRLLQKIELI